MNWKIVDRVVAAAVFVYALALYLLTVAPTASFWDSGEFIAIANRLEVSHPPGAPFYMLVGRLFSMFVPTEYVALSVNLISVLASAVTVLLTFLIIVRLVREWQGPPADWTPSQRIVALTGGVIGACTFAVTDSFWFNAAEAEVYALSMLFTAAVVWLIMKWSEQARHEEEMLRGGQHPFGLSANRYLILIAYLFGLATGVHLLNLLALFFIALIFFFTEFDHPEWSTTKRWQGIVGTGLISAAAFLMIYPVIIQKLPEWAGESGAPLLFVLGVVAIVVFSVYYTHRQRMQVVNLVALSVLMVLVGYSTYALIFIRSAADPPIDENDPETTEAIVSYLRREQYGQTPLLTGPSFDDVTGRVDPNSETFLPRRYSQQPQHQRVYARYDSDWTFFWDYQVGHMYVRYFLWNFSGRASDVQDAPAITGFDVIDRAPNQYFQTPSEHASRNAYYALPLLLGLFGALFHFMSDWRRAFSVLVLFLLTGLGIILYLNQTPMQPRERDYSYVASFFAFSLWVGIGATGMLQLLLDTTRETLSTAAQRGLLLALGGVLFVAVPGLMAVENYDDHDRSGRYVAPEYAYNMLMSLDENAVVFTNGDNDTFPLWYLQEVEGVRRDVRVANLSLLNTPWYVRQLKNQWSRQSPPVPISLSDEEVERLGAIQWKPREITLPVDKEQLVTSSEVYIPMEDTSRIQSPMRWRLEGRPYAQDVNILYGADIAALNILQTNAEQGWERPIYFAVTVSPDGQLNLQNYFQLEGQAFRIVPIRHDEQLGRVVPSITPKRLKQFKFTNLDDPDVYYDENIRRMVDNYRNMFAHTAEKLIEVGQEQEARELLDMIMDNVPFDTIPGDVRSFVYMARPYQRIGDKERVVEIMQQAEPLVLHRLASTTSSRETDMVAQYVQMVRLTYLEVQAFDAAAEFSNKLADFLGDDTFRQTAEELRSQYEAAFDDSTLLPETVPPGQ